MKKVISSVLGVLSIFALNVNALNLEEAIDIALKSNLTIKSSEYDFLETKEIINSYNSAFKPRLNLGYSYENRNRPNITQESEFGVLSLQASYNLFNGFSDSANIDYAKYLSKSSKYSLEATKFDTILNVKTAYINYLNAKNALKTYESSYKLYQEQYKDSKNRYEQGLIAKNDLLQVQVLMSTAKQNIASAKGTLNTTKYILSNYLGGKNLKNEVIEDIDEKALKINTYEIKELKNRSEIKALEMTLESIKKQKIVKKSSYYPKINATYSYNHYFDTFTLKKLDAPAKKHQNIAGLSANWNIYSGGYNDSQVNIIKTRYLKAKTQLEDTKLKINLQYETAKSNLEVAIENLKTAKVSLLQSKENYTIVKNRFNEGIATSTELTDANFLLTQATQGYNRAYFNKFLAIATLDRIFEKEDKAILK